MLKRIKKMIPPSRFVVPLLGLFVTIGAIGQKAQPVLSKQIARLQEAKSTTIASDRQVPTSYASVEQNSDIGSESISKEARLRRVLNSSSPESQSSEIPISPGKTYIWMQRNSSSNSENFLQKLESVSTQRKTIQNKVSIKRANLRKNFPSSDGVFLYGSSPRFGEFGHGYIIFENLGGKVVGGMYMVASEFNCFQGNLERTGQIAMTVKGYAGDINLSQVASRNRLPQTNEDELTNYPYSVQLKNYYQLDTIGNKERDILKTCKTYFQ